MKFTNSLKLVLIYLAAGLVWIYFSDSIVAFVFRSEKQQQFYQTIKGFLYVISTAILLYILLRKFYEAQIGKIYELRSKEYTIQESESRYQILFKEGPIANLVFDSATNLILDTNDKAQTFFGLSKEEMIGRKISEIIYDDRVKSNTSNYSVFDTQIIFHTRPDGSSIVIEVTAHPFKLKGTSCILLSCNDITEREKAVNSLKENQRKLITAQKIAKIGYWQYIIHSGEMYWSDEVYEMWGVDKENFEPTYYSFYNSIHPHDRHLLPASAPDSFDGYAEYDIEHRIILSDGAVKWVHEKGTYQRDEKGIPVYLEGTVQDITTQKLLSIALEEHLQRYNYASKATSDAIWDWNLENNSVVWGDSSNRLLLYSKLNSDENFSCWEDHIVIEDKEKVLTSLTEALHSREQYWSAEYRCHDTDSNYMNVSNNGYILRNKQGKAIRVIGAIQDITKKKKESLQTEFIAEISNAFSNDQSLEHSLSSVLRLLIKIGNFDIAEAWLVGKERKQINLAVHCSKNAVGEAFYSDPNMVSSFLIGQGMPGKCWEMGAMIHWNDIANSDLFVRSAYARKSGITSMYAIPLKHNHNILGVVILGLENDNLDSKMFSKLLDSFHSHLASEICRKQTEQELNQLFEFAPDMICIAGVDGFYKKVNPAMTEILGYSKAELLSKPVSDFVHPEDISKTQKQIELLKTGLPTIYFENRYITKLGVVKWLAWTATPPSNEGLVFSVGKDISDKKELELLLNKATTLARIGAWEIDLISNTINWSPITRRIHGIDDDQYNPNFDEATNFYKEGENRETIIQKVTRAIQDGEKWDIELQIVTRKNEIKWVRSIGEPEFFDGKCTRIVGSFQDIDQSKRAELLTLEVLKEKETILERIDDAFIAVDINWNITYWNNMAERILGRKRNEVVGYNIWETYADAVDTPFYYNYQEAIRTGEPKHFEAFYEGIEAWFDVSAFPSETGLSIFFKDVTERRNYITAIEKHNETLKQIAWSQSHEVRAPLARILGLINVISETNIPTSDELQQILNMLAISANELDDIIRKINEKTLLK